VGIFRSGYDDKYYKPFTEDRRLLADPMEGKSPAFPGPDAECIVSKGVNEETALFLQQIIHPIK
jgi:hypothetical protein